MPAFLIRLASFFSFGVLVGNFLTFFFESWLLLMKVIVVDALLECGDIGIWELRLSTILDDGWLVPSHRATRVTFATP